MARPTYYPEWATTDTTLPVAGTSNKSRPKESLRTIGWDKSQIPAAEELNWQLDNVYDWVVYFDALNSLSKTVTFIGDVSGSFSFSNNSSTIGDVTLQVADNSHNHLSSNITDATELATANKVAKRDSNGSIAFKNILSDRVISNSSGTSNDPTNPSIAFGETVNDTGLYPISDNVFGVTTGGVSRGYWDSNGWNGNVIGNASTSSKWVAPRTLFITGAAEGQVSFDGSANFSVNVSLTGFANSKTESGFSYLGNGLILQWTKISSIPEGVGSVVTLPVTFPTSCLSAQCTLNYTADGNAHAAHIVSFTSSTVTVCPTAEGSMGNSNVYVLAIGY